MRPKWTFSIDLDGILCEVGPMDKYPVAKPMYENIRKVNKLYANGYNIIINTSRSWGSYEITKSWLKAQGIRHTELVMGKVLAHYYIDDHSETLDNAMKILEGKDENFNA